MIQRKLTAAGDVSGFWDTDTNNGKGGWVPETDHDETTNESGVALTEDAAELLIEARQNESDKVNTPATDADDAGEPTEVDPDSLTKDQLVAEITRLGGEERIPQRASKAQLVEIYTELNQDITE